MRSSSSSKVPNLACIVAGFALGVLFTGWQAFGHVPADRGFDVHARDTFQTRPDQEGLIDLVAFIGVQVGKRGG